MEPEINPHFPSGSVVGKERCALQMLALSPKSLCDEHCREWGRNTVKEGGRACCWASPLGVQGPRDSGSQDVAGTQRVAAFGKQGRTGCQGFILVCECFPSRKPVFCLFSNQSTLTCLFYS